MSDSKLLLLGAGGHCRSVLDSINKSLYTDIVIVDMPELVGQIVDNLPIIGTDDDIPELFFKGYKRAAITVGSVGSPKIRIKLYKLLKATGFELPVIIDPSAVLSQHATVEEGVFIGKGAILNAGVRIGYCSIINSGAIIDHDTSIGCFTHVSPGSSISGFVTIGDYTHLGTGCAVIDTLSIGENTTIGAGSVVVRDIPKNVVAYGNPCKVQRKRDKV